MLLILDSGRMLGAMALFNVSITLVFSILSVSSLKYALRRRVPAMTRARHPSGSNWHVYTSCAWVLPIQNPTATLRLVVSCAVAGTP